MYDNATFDYHYDQYNSTGRTEAVDGSGLVNVGDGRQGVSRSTGVKRPGEMDDVPVGQQGGVEGKKKKKKKRKKGPHIASEEDLVGDDGQFGIFTKPSAAELALMEDSMTSVQTGEMHDYQLEKREESREKETAKKAQDEEADDDSNLDRMIER